MQMSLEQPDRPEIRRSVKTVVQAHESVTVEELVADVARRYDSHEGFVLDVLNSMEKHGFVYLVGEGADAEVRLP
jgi:hypothetical protein